LKRIWYHIVKLYIKTGLFFFYKKIEVRGTEHIPVKGAVLFVSNHKNALIDPLLIATTNKRNIHFLTRASAFKIGIVKWILSTVNMLPIYRLRDGKETLAKNEVIFNKCYKILGKQQSLLIFPEGTHDIRRLVRPLSKGFTRITFGALAHTPGLALNIIPVGLNYTKAEIFGERVSIIYGKAIAVNPFYNPENLNASALALKEEVSSKMKELTTHVDDQANYDSIIQKLGAIDYLNPDAVNERIKNLPQSHSDSIATKPPSFLWRLLNILVIVNSLFPWFIWKAIQPKIKEIEFIATTKFAIGITGFPLFYSLQALVVHSFFGMWIALIYFVLSIISVLALVKMKN
tara:strand:+ start:65878 stop:66915 length:1038 start_codon:yes stop_codon:yes gene_type:complete